MDSPGSRFVDLTEENDLGCGDGCLASWIHISTLRFLLTLLRYHSHVYVAFGVSDSGSIGMLESCLSIE